MAPTPARGEPIPDEAIYAAYDDYLRQRPHTPPRAVFRDVVRELLTEQRAADYAAAADAAIESGFAAQAAADAAIAGAFTEDGPVPLAVIGYLDQAAQEVVAEVVMDGVVVSTIRQGYHQLREYRDLIAASYQYARGPEGTAVPAALPAREGAPPNLEPHFVGYHIPTVETPLNGAVDHFDCGDTCAAEPPTAGHFRERGAIVHAFRAQDALYVDDTYVPAHRWVVTRGDGAIETYSHEHFGQRFEYVGD